MASQLTGSFSIIRRLKQARETGLADIQNEEHKKKLDIFLYILPN